jgi:hypothetical protein
MAQEVCPKLEVQYSSKLMPQLPKFKVTLLSKDDDEVV